MSQKVARERIKVGAATLSVRPAGAGEAIVLIPSLGRSGNDFASLAAVLAESGYRSMPVDPRGVGESTGPLEGITLHDLAADVAGVIEALDAAPAHILGHAFGNRIARCLAADRPKLVRTVILLAAGGLVKPDREAWSAFRRALAGELSESQRLAAIKTAHFAPASDPSAWREGWWPAAAAAQLAASDATPREDWWESGEAPLLVVQGLEDRIALPANGRALRETLGDRVRLVELKNAGHALLPEQPEVLTDTVLTFLREHRSPQVGPGWPSAA